MVAAVNVGGFAGKSLSANTLHDPRGCEML